MRREEGKEHLQDKMRTHAACRPDPDFIVDEQMPYVSQLADKHGNPIYFHKHIAHSEWGWMGMALAKDSAAGMSVVVP